MCVTIGVILGHEANRSLLTPDSRLLCDLKRGKAHQPSGSLPGVIKAIEHFFFLLATHRSSQSVRKSVAALAPCLISWETFLLLELPIYSCEKMLWGGGRAWHPGEEKRESAI